MKDDQIKQLQDRIKYLELAMELIATARQHGRGIHFAEGVAEEALKRSRGQVAA